MEEGLKVAVWVAIITAILGMLTKAVEVALNWKYERLRIKNSEEIKKNNDIESMYYEYIELLESFYMTIEQVLKSEKKIFEIYDVVFEPEKYYIQRFDEIQKMKKISMQISFLKNKLNFKIGLVNSGNGKMAKEMLLASGELVDEVTSRFKKERNYDSFEDLDEFIARIEDLVDKQKSITEGLTKFLIKYQAD